MVRLYSTRHFAVTDVAIAIVIPAHNAARFLSRSLPWIRNCFSGVPLLVVDDGSTDGTAELARSFGVGILQVPSRAGPAAARNLGAKETEADIIFFLDADCVPHRDALERVRLAFRTDSGLVALSGSYDADPPEPDFFSRYVNLRHHFTHQRSRRESASFWAGCGAVRRREFLEAGGFDAARFPRPQIEDIELATRLRRFGRLRLDRELQVTHLKRWSLRSLVTAEVADRAIPWTRLIVETAELPDDLNLRRSERVAGAIAPLALAAVPVALWAMWQAQWIFLVPCTMVIAASLLLNWPLFRFLARRQSVAFAAGAWLFHQLHLSYSGVVFVFAAAYFACRRATRNGPPEASGPTTRPGNDPR